MPRSPLAALLLALSTLAGAGVAARAASGQQTFTVPSSATPTIQSAIDAAHSGDTVKVLPGTYQENLVINAKEINLTGTQNINTFLDGQGLGSVISISNTPSLKTSISNFTISNGRSGSSGSSAGVLLTNAGATVTGNSFNANAVAVSVVNGSVVLSYSQISTVIATLPTCSTGNGIRLSGNSSVTDSSGNQVPSSITYNTISATGKCTGGTGIIAQQGSDLTIEGNNISGQTLAINTFPIAGTLLILNNLIANNTQGGLTLIHSTVSPAAQPTDAFIVNNTFANNLSGVKTLSGAAGPAEIAISGTFSRVALVNNILATSSATNPLLDCAGTAPTSTSNSTPILLDHNLFYNPTGKLGIDACPITIGQFANLNANPQFVSSTNYQLAPGSPAIDAGNNSAPYLPRPDFDVTYNRRIQNATHLPIPIIDIGAYEAAGTISDISYLNLAANPYFVTSGNSFALTAQLTSENLLNGVQTIATNASVTFTPSNTVLTPTTSVTDTTGTASAAYTVASPGLYPFTATYTGPAYPAALSVPIYVYVAAPLAVTTLTLTSSQNPSITGQPVTFTLTSSGSDSTHPTPITLSDGATLLTTLTPNAAGLATYTTSSLTVGTHTLTAAFAGDATHTPATATLTQQVGDFTSTFTSLTSSLNPSLAGQTITLRAQATSASGIPTGSFTFLNNNTPLGPAIPADSSGAATFSTYTLPTGTLSLSASFAASSPYAGSTGTLTQVVNGNPTNATLAVLDPIGSLAGSPSTFIATITSKASSSPVPTGTVTFIADGKQVLMPVPLANATATLQYTLPLGTHIVTCNYSGDTFYAPGFCNTVSTTITAPPTSLSLNGSPNPATSLTPITFTAQLNSVPSASTAGALITLTGLPTGPVTATTNASGLASYTTPSLPPGLYALQATFATTSSLLGSSSTLQELVNVNFTTTSLTASPKAGVQNAPITLSASVSGNNGNASPTGTVTFSEGSTVLGSAPLAPNTGFIAFATFTLSTLTPGTHQLTATYTPATSSFLPSQSPAVTVTIAPQDFTFTTQTPTLSIQTEHHATLQLTLTSIGGFTTQIALSCGTLPASLTCELPPATPLAANTTTQVPLTLDTDAVLDFKSQAKPPHLALWQQTTLAALFPLTFLALTRRNRRKLQASRLLKTILLTTGTLLALSLTACSGKYPAHTPPGTYTISIAATGLVPGNTTPTTHVLNLTLTVTQ